MSSYLSELCRFYDRLSGDPLSGMPPEGMSAEKISFALVISPDGDLVDVRDLRDSEGHVLRCFVPAAVKRTVNPISNFLWDNTGYVLGVDGKGKKEKTQKTAEVFRERHRAMLSSCDDVHARALLAFLDKWRPEHFEALDLREALLDSNVVFQLKGEDTFLHQAAALQELWLDSLGADDDAGMGICLITGRQGAIARTHPSIKGVSGAQSSGAALVSFNCPSFTSYGKQQNANAPVIKSAASAYTSALNYLLAREHRQMVRVGDTCIIFWADRPSPAETLFGGIFDLEETKDSSLQDRKQLKRLKGILRALREGHQLNEADKALEAGTRFFVLGLAPNAARLSVRFWLTDTLEVLLERFSRWYEDLHIERQFPDSEPEFPPLWLLLLRSAAAQGKSENLPPELGGQVARAMLCGSSLPENLFATVLQRIHADKKMDYFRAALIKAYLRRNKREDKDMTTLNTEESNTGYRLGRLFALLEKAQKDALGAVNAPLRERYIGAASATPRLVFPMLLRLAQHHVTKAQKSSFDKYDSAFSKRVAEITADMTDFPAVLSLEDQGRFMLGYYHQNNAFYQKKTDSGESAE